MNIFYIDYENVSSQGLKGIELLSENDEVVLLYSKKADNVKIEILTMMMESKARIRFLPVHVGTPNALDFQLVTLLFLNYRNEDHCYIISKDSGYDCCIKTAAENGAPNVARYPNIESAVNKTPAKKTRSRRRTTAEPDAPQAAVIDNKPEPPVQPFVPEQADSLEAPGETSPALPEEAGKKKSSRRRGRKKAAPAETEGSQSAQPSLENSMPKKGAEPDGKDRSSENGSEKPSEKDTEPAQENGSKQAREKEKPQEHVLQQRYLSKQFEAKGQQPSLSGSKPDTDKPVSILSVIRRRNDVQLDMHQIDLIREALKNSSNKQQFYSYFVKKLGQKQGIELYHSVKSSYTDLVNATLL